MRELKNNTDGSAIPLILFVAGVFGTGAVYTLLFIVVALPSFSVLIPDSVFKTIIIGIVYFAPLIVLVIGVLALILAGMKRTPSWTGGRI